MASRARRRVFFSVSIACVFDLSFISIRSFLISMFLKTAIALINIRIMVAFLYFQCLTVNSAIYHLQYTGTITGLRLIAMDGKILVYLPGCNHEAYASYRLKWLYHMTSSAFFANLVCDMPINITVNTSSSYSLHSQLHFSTLDLLRKIAFLKLRPKPAICKSSDIKCNVASILSLLK